MSPHIKERISGPKLLGKTISLLGVPATALKEHMQTLMTGRE